MNVKNKAFIYLLNNKKHLFGFKIIEFFFHILIFLLKIRLYKINMNKFILEISKKLLLVIEEIKVKKIPPSNGKYVFF
jgi:hypothetical protein